jgi:hypothetical protein
MLLLLLLMLLVWLLCQACCELSNLRQQAVGNAME